jgi:hypothetical protein
MLNLPEITKIITYFLYPKTLDPMDQQTFVPLVMVYFIIQLYHNSISAAYFYLNFEMQEARS